MLTMHSDAAAPTARSLVVLMKLKKRLIWTDFGRTRVSDPDELFVTGQVSVAVCEGPAPEAGKSQCRRSRPKSARPQTELCLDLL
jgi:hypothetical protein